MHEGKSMIGAARQVAVISLATVILAIAPLYGAMRRSIQEERLRRAKAKTQRRRRKSPS